MTYLETYLSTRRAGWPYEDCYEINPFGEHGFAAKIAGNVACLAWADISGTSAVMHMTLKPEYAEFGIGTELLHVLMDHLVDSGFKTIRYTISVEHWAFQIYYNLGFKIESRDQEHINFVREV